MLIIGIFSSVFHFKILYLMRSSYIFFLLIRCFSFSCSVSVGSFPILTVQSTRCRRHDQRRRFHSRSTGRGIYFISIFYFPFYIFFIFIFSDFIFIELFTPKMNLCKWQNEIGYVWICVWCRVCIVTRRRLSHSRAFILRRCAWAECD